MVDAALHAGRQECGRHGRFQGACAFTIHGEGRHGPTGEDAETGMGHYGRITDLADLPIESVVTERLHAARERRVAQATEWIAEGKKRNWKYEIC